MAFRSYAGAPVAYGYSAVPRGSVSVCCVVRRRPFACRVRADADRGRVYHSFFAELLAVANPVSFRMGRSGFDWTDQRGWQSGRFSWPLCDGISALAHRLVHRWADGFADVYGGRRRAGAVIAGSKASSRRRSRRLVKIMRGHFGAGQLERLDVRGFYRNDAILTLQEALDLQECVMNDDGVVAFKKLRRDNDVGHSGFVFEAQKHKTFGRAGALANNDRANYIHGFAVGQVLQYSGWRDAMRVELRAILREWMWANRQASAVKIGEDTLLCRHRVQG